MLKGGVSDYLWTLQTWVSADSIRRVIRGHSVGFCFGPPALLGNSPRGGGGGIMCGLWKPGGTWPGGKIMAGDWFDSGILPATFTTCVTVFAESSGTTNAETESRQGRLEHGGRVGAVDVYLCAASLSAAYCG